MSGVIGERMLNLKTDITDFVTNYARGLFPEVTSTVDTALGIFGNTSLDRLGGSRVDEVITQLLTWRDRGTALFIRNLDVGDSIATSLHNSNFIIESISFTKEKGYGLDRVDFEIELIEILVANLGESDANKGAEDEQTILGQITSALGAPFNDSL